MRWDPRDGTPRAACSPSRCSRPVPRPSHGRTSAVRSRSPRRGPPWRGRASSPPAPGRSRSWARPCSSPTARPCSGCADPTAASCGGCRSSTGTGSPWRAAYVVVERSRTGSFVACEPTDSRSVEVFDAATGSPRWRAEGQVRAVVRTDAVYLTRAADPVTTAHEIADGRTSVDGVGHRHRQRQHRRTAPLRPAAPRYLAATEEAARWRPSTPAPAPSNADGSVPATGTRWSPTRRWWRPTTTPRRASAGARSPSPRSRSTARTSAPPRPSAAGTPTTAANAPSPTPTTASPPSAPAPASP